MRFFKRVAGFLGFGKDEWHETKENEYDTNNPNNNDNNNDNKNSRRMNVDPVHVGPRRGFSVPVQVPVDRPFVGPILVPCNGDGGLQGFRWYIELLRVDEDGDIADEFFHEIPPDLSLHSHFMMDDQPKPLPRFQVKTYERRPKLIDHKLTPDGNFQHLVLYQAQV